jgi:hypothetical protein
LVLAEAKGAGGPAHMFAPLDAAAHMFAPLDAQFDLSALDRAVNTRPLTCPPPPSTPVGSDLDNYMHVRVPEMLGGSPAERKDKENVLMDALERNCSVRSNTLRVVHPHRPCLLAENGNKPDWMRVRGVLLFDAEGGSLCAPHRVRVLNPEPGSPRLVAEVLCTPEGSILGELSLATFFVLFGDLVCEFLDSNGRDVPWALAVVETTEVFLSESERSEWPRREPVSYCGVRYVSGQATLDPSAASVDAVAQEARAFARRAVEEWQAMQETCLDAAFWRAAWPLR